MEHIKNEDMCLDVEQADTLKCMGIDMTDTMFVYVRKKPGNKLHVEEEYIHDDYSLCMNNDWIRFNDTEYVNTMTEQEMIHLITECKDKCKLDIEHEKDVWFVSYECEAGGVSVSGILMRDALYDLIRWMMMNEYF